LSMLFNVDGFLEWVVSLLFTWLGNINKRLGW
jgi:hypothetical protein